MPPAKSWQLGAKKLLAERLRSPLGTLLSQDVLRGDAVQLDERRILLRIARQSILDALLGRTHTLDTTLELTERLKEPAGVFVTLTHGGELRGCIGSVYPDAPLFKAVAESAVNAALRDPRFPPLTLSDIEQTEIEISVMGPVTEVKEHGDIEVGRDGLILSGSGKKGLLLPQVATERGWDREKFLSETCVKAGLPADGWREAGCQIEKFTAEVFSEADSGQSLSGV